MTTNEVLSEALEVWKKHDNYLASEPNEKEHVNVNKLMANLFFPGEYYYYIIDAPTFNLESVSDNTESVLGIKAEDFSFIKLVEIVHPDDVQFALKCEDLIAQFLKNHIPVSKITKYKVSYCLRERTKDGSYQLFLMQTIALSINSEGALLKVFGSHTDISHITTTNNRKLSIIGLDGEPSYLNIDVFDENPLYNSLLPKKNPLFSNRELEIIKLLAQGFKTSEIADELCISELTVETHRKNILKKSKAKTTIELVVDCMKKGYI